MELQSVFLSAAAHLEGILVWRLDLGPTHYAVLLQGEAAPIRGEYCGDQSQVTWPQYSSSGPIRGEYCG